MFYSSVPFHVYRAREMRAERMKHDANFLELRNNKDLTRLPRHDTDALEPNLKTQVDIMSDLSSHDHRYHFGLVCKDLLFIALYHFKYPYIVGADCNEGRDGYRSPSPVPIRL